jgi:hypothetical protein
MSFTSVKSSRLHARLQYQPESPYTGFLLKNVNWQSLPPEAFGIIQTVSRTKGWLYRGFGLNPKTAHVGTNSDNPWRKISLKPAE